MKTFSIKYPTTEASECKGSYKWTQNTKAVLSFLRNVSLSLQWHVKHSIIHILPDQVPLTHEHKRNPQNKNEFFPITQSYGLKLCLWAATIIFKLYNSETCASHKDAYKTAIVFQSPNRYFIPRFDWHSRGSDIGSNANNISNIIIPKIVRNPQTNNILVLQEVYVCHWSLLKCLTSPKLAFNLESAPKNTGDSGHWKPYGLHMHLVIGQIINHPGGIYEF